jgi:ketosteroid isomerase-like protein
MTSDARTELALPPLIATYFAADTSDADTVARCFREDAVVVDEHRTHRGRAAIARWKAEATAKYHYTCDPVSQETVGHDTVVTARVSGDFPGSPAMLQYRFTLESNAIARLEITA